jgi:trans-aconitate methyltransferase
MRVDIDAFDALYRDADDPWSFATSEYELSRYRSVIENLSRERYERCFEPGCSIGVLTQMLAERVAEVVACEASPTAISAAAIRTVDLAGVDLHLATIPEWWPVGSFDLIVLSEIGYYWDREGLGDVLDRVVSSADPTGCELLAVHWTGHSDDHLLTGDEVHEVIAQRFGEPQVSTRRVGDAQHGYVLERWSVS